MNSIKTFTIDQQLADQLEQEVITSSIPKYTYLKRTAEYPYNNRSPTAGGMKIIHAQGFTNGVYTMHRHFPLHGSFEDMLKKDPTNTAVVAPSIANITFHLRERFLDPSYDVVRVYANIMTIGVEYGVLDPHPDLKDPDAVTFLYYVIDSDGDTFIFDEKEDKVVSRHSPKKGTGIMYPSSTIHAASVPMKHEIRSALNIIYGKNYYKRFGQNVIDQYNQHRVKQTRRR
jgi:hypothetical protein